jgi:hypothetical protein
MSKHCGGIFGTRSNALWGSNGRGGEHRSNALWGRGGRKAVLVLFALSAVISLPAAAVAGGGKGGDQNGAVVPANLIAQAQANPDQLFHVIVQGTKGNKSDTVAQDVSAQNGKLKRKFFSISGVAADLSGKDLLKLAQHPHILRSPQTPPSRRRATRTPRCGATRQMLLPSGTPPTR